MGKFSNNLKSLLGIHACSSVVLKKNGIFVLQRCEYEVYTSTSKVLLSAFAVKK